MPRQDEPVSVNYPEDYDPSLNGIGGWLVLVIIGQIIRIILSIKDITDSVSLFGVLPAFDVILYFGVAVDIIFGIVLPVIILILMFSRNITFRILFVIGVSVIFLFNIFVILYLQALGYNIFSEYAGSLIGSIAGGVIWILYLYKSERVKNTYIYPKTYPY
jgi:hypothetical protein